MNTDAEEPSPKPLPEEAMGSDVVSPPRAKSRRSWIYPLLVIASFMMGLLVSLEVWGRQPARAASGGAEAPVAAAQSSQNNASAAAAAAFLDQVNPPQGYKLPVSYDSLGPALLQSGAIDFDKFAEVYSQAGDPLTQGEIDVLQKGGDEQVIITSQNAHFLLNFFWAVGLVNRNPMLTDGPITTESKGRIDGFASTGGWTIGAKPVTELFASTDLIQLTPEQQSRVQDAASAIYRPCCDNPTFFPDCNHGMAMLGLLELMGSRNASVDEMLQAAKYVNAYWFPQQAVEIAILLKTSQNVDFAAADPRLVVGPQLSSGSGSGQLHAHLKSNGLLPASPDGGGGCGA